MQGIDLQSVSAVILTLISLGGLAYVILMPSSLRIRETRG
jgi:hypothetical protein